MMQKNITKTSSTTTTAAARILISVCVYGGILLCVKILYAFGTIHSIVSVC